MKTKIEKYGVELLIIALLIGGAALLLHFWNPLNTLRSLMEPKPIPVVQVQDTPEYKQLQKDKDKLDKEIDDMKKRDMDTWKTHIIDSLTIHGLQNQTQQSYVIYKDKNKQVEKNSNNTNISDLHNRIKLLPKH